MGVGATAPAGGREVDRGCPHGLDLGADHPGDGIARLSACSGLLCLGCEAFAGFTCFTLLSSIAMLERAIEFAVKCHAGQYRKHAIGGQRLPYIVHPIEVMRTVWGWGVTEPIIMTAAVLHDVLEESDVTARQLDKEFGEEVAQLVTELTHDPQEGDKYEYLKRFSTASVPALVVKLADRYCNIQHRLVAYPAGVKAYFGKSAVLLEIMRSRHAEIAGRFSEEVSAAIAFAYQSLESDVKQIAGEVQSGSVMGA